MNGSPPPKNLNLEDIARLSGVSRSTVSRVINRSPHVSEETRQRVNDVIAAHNYVPNTAARSLVTQRTRVLGLYIPHVVGDLFTDPYFPMLIQGISLHANQREYDVLLWLHGSADQPTYQHRRVLDNRMADGLILASTARDDPLLELLAGQARPVVVNGRPWQHADAANYVDATNVQGARQAILHLARLGRRRIATIAGRLELCSGHDRLLGYREGLAQADLPHDPELEARGDFTESGGYTAMRRLWPQRPDAVFVASDQMALGALRALREAGARVPDDVALVGFDDMPFATMVQPELTTVRQPVQRLGALAADGLIGLIEGTVAPPYQVHLPTQLVIRQSCGFPS